MQERQQKYTAIRHISNDIPIFWIFLFLRDAGAFCFWPIRTNGQISHGDLEVVQMHDLSVDRSRIHHARTPLIRLYKQLLFRMLLKRHWRSLEHKNFFVRISPYYVAPNWDVRKDGFRKWPPTPPCGDVHIRFWVEEWELRKGIVMKNPREEGRCNEKLMAGCLIVMLSENQVM